MNKKNKRLWLAIAIVFAFCITLAVMEGMMTHPWNVIPSLFGDGGKNAFTFLFHIMYDKHALHFSGMNYPYGEHIVYTDGQPLLSIPLNYLNHYMTLGRALTIMWWLIALSYILAIVYCYKLLAHFGVRPWVSICFAGLIIMLSPQVVRLSGHFALSYICIIPMVFYWAVQYHESSKRKYAVYLFLLGVLAAFLHPYFAALILVWTGFYIAGYLLLSKAKFADRLKHIIPQVIAVGGIFVIFGVFMKVTDPLTDRPQTPWGMLVNCTHIKDIISSSYSPVWQHFMSHGLFQWASAGDEGYAYPGLAVLIAVIVSFILGVIYKVRKKQNVYVVREQGFQPVWLFLAFATLLFSMGVPFIWNMEFLLDYASALKQFRTLGRFSWIFYYIIAIYGSVVISEWYERNSAAGRKALAWTVLVAPIVLWFYEANVYVRPMHSAGQEGVANYAKITGANGSGWEPVLNARHYKKEDFQATLVLPFMEIGSEKLWLGNDVFGWGVEEILKCGLQLQLPNIDVVMSRSAWGQAFKQVRLAGGPYADKAMLRDLKNDKPFLLLLKDDIHLDPDQAYLLTASDSIGKLENIIAYACYPGRIKANDKKYADSISALLPWLHTGDTCLRNTGTWFAAHFDQGHAKNKLFGTGAAAYDTTHDVVLAIIPLRPACDNQLYEFSCWFLTPAENYKTPYCTIDNLDSAKQVIGVRDALTKESTDNYGLWLRDQVYFSLPANTRYVRIHYARQEENSYSAMDEMLLMPADALIVSKAPDGSVMVNNHLFNTRQP